MGPGAILRCRRVCPWIRKRESEEEPQTSETKVRATLARDYSRGSRPAQLAAGRREHRRARDEQRAGAGISAVPPCRTAFSPASKVSQRGGIQANALSFQQYSRFLLTSPLFSSTFPLHAKASRTLPLFSMTLPRCSVKKIILRPRKQTSCPIEKADSSAAFIPAGFRLRTDLRRRIEKSPRQCPRAPAEWTLTNLAYLAQPVKRKNAAVRGAGVWSH